MRHSCLRTRIRVFSDLPELKTRNSTSREGNSGSISLLITQKSPQETFSVHFARPAGKTGGSTTDVKELTNRFVIPAARLTKTRQNPRKRTRLKERPGIRTGMSVHIRCRPFIGHTPRKLPVSKYRNLPLHRTSSLVILTHFFRFCNSLEQEIM